MDMEKESNTKALIEPLSLTYIDSNLPLEEQLRIEQLNESIQLEQDIQILAECSHIIHNLAEKQEEEILEIEEKVDIVVEASGKATQHLYRAASRKLEYLPYIGIMVALLIAIVVLLKCEANSTLSSIVLVIAGSCGYAVGYAIRTHKKKSLRQNKPRLPSSTRLKTNLARTLV